MANRVLISDTDSGHADSIKSAIVAGYGSDISADIAILLTGSIVPDMAYAWVNGFVAVVYSAAGASVGLATSALRYFPAIQGFFTLGSNTSEEITTFSSVPSIVIVGAGDTQNRTAYGDGLEFWDDDDGAADFASSFSNGVICGKLLKIRDGRGGSWWDARYAARQTASGGGSRTDADGYGQIDVAAAVAYAGSVIANPYIPNSVQQRVGAIGRRR